MTIFTTKAELECVRCHKVKNPSGETVGGEVGPELSGIGGRQSRAYLLESIFDPNKQIAQGFESVVLATSDGKVHTGVLRGEDDQGGPADHRRRDADGRCPRIRSKTASAVLRRCPTDLAKKLSKTELRDLIEFLANLKVK